MSKRDELATALKVAMHDKDQVALSTIRLITAALKDRDILARGNGNVQGISEAEILSLLQSMVKQRQESSETYANAGRDDLADREMEEIEVIRRFMPTQMSESEMNAAIDDIVRETGAENIKDMGKVMTVLKEKHAGQLDMAKAGGAVKKRLAS
jgi:uncharacterized protein YqeY